MITITQPKCIDGESLEKWLNSYLKNDLSVDNIYLLPYKPLDCTSESNCFTTIDVDNHISKEILISKMVDISNDKSAYFYIQDVVEAACGAGVLTDNYYHFFHKNCH